MDSLRVLPPPSVNLAVIAPPPSRMMSPFLMDCSPGLIRVSFRKVPLVLSRSLMKNPEPVSMIIACLRETRASSKTTSLSACLPRVVWLASALR